MLTPAGAIFLSVPAFPGLWTRHDALNHHRRRYTTSTLGRDAAKAGLEVAWARYGFLTVALARWLPYPNYRLLLIVGVLGGYTTFSTFEYDSLTLWERGEWGLSLANMAGSLLAGFVAVALGVGLGRAVTIPAAERMTAALLERVDARTRPRVRALLQTLGLEPAGVES